MKIKLTPKQLAFKNELKEKLIQLANSDHDSAFFWDIVWDDDRFEEDLKVEIERYGADKYYAIRNACSMQINYYKNQLNARIAEVMFNLEVTISNFEKP